MAVRIEPKKIVIGNEQSEGYQILHRAFGIPFLHKFLGYNIQVSKQFAEPFDGNKAQIGNLTLFIIEEFISQVTGLP